MSNVSPSEYWNYFHRVTLTAICYIQTQTCTNKLNGIHWNGYNVVAFRFFCVLRLLYQSSAQMRSETQIKELSHHKWRLDTKPGRCRSTASHLKGRLKSPLQLQPASPVPWKMRLLLKLPIKVPMFVAFHPAARGRIVFFNLKNEQNYRQILLN